MTTLWDIWQVGKGDHDGEHLTPTRMNDTYNEGVQDARQEHKANESPDGGNQKILEQRS